MKKQHPALKLMDEIEKLFSSGADELHSEEELLNLLDGLRWSQIIHPIIHNAVQLYEYSVDGPLCYRGAELLCDDGPCNRAFRLYQSTDPAQTVGGVTYQRSLELWISDKMDLFVTSCFRLAAGNTASEYRAWLDNDWLNTELDIDFSIIHYFTNWIFYTW